MITEPSRRTRQNLQSDEELAVVHSLIQAARMAGIRADRQAIVNMYISLKSRPFLILAGEKHTGKIDLVSCLAQVLTEEPARQRQFFVGHARWAAQSQNVAHFVEMQARLNRSKLLAMIEKAMQPENADQLFIACLNRISPAELYDYFHEAGLQLWPDHGQKTSISYPPNFRLIGTLDTTRFTWWDVELLRYTTVVQWPGEKMEKCIKNVGETAVFNSTPHFLQTCIDSEQRAYSRLQHLSQGQSQAFLPLMQVLAALEDANANLPQEVVKRVMVYLANAWSEDGHGLFAPLLRPNLQSALDLALVQHVLPWIVAVRPDPEWLLSHLAQLFNEQFEQAAAFINVLSGRLSLPKICQPNYL